MKQLKFLETKRTPRYSLRKFSVGMVSVLLGVTIFGINFTNHSVKAATTESVKSSNSSPETQSSAATANNFIESATTPQSAPNTQGSASKNATANNSTESATTSQSLPKTQGSAHTYIRSLAAKSAAKLATMNLMQTNGINATGTPDTDGNAASTTGTGSDRNAAGTVDQNNTNTQPAKENQELANKTNLTSSDNYSSNIYKGTDGKDYKIVTIYGQDYVYRTADIQANGTNWRGYVKGTAEDNKNNINISKKDLGNGKTRWTVVFFPNRGLQNVGSSLSGLSSAKFGIALTFDYQIVGNVDMDVISDPNQPFTSYTFEPGSNSSTNNLINPLAEKKFSFDPKTDVDRHTGLINSETMPAYNNQYLQGSYYFTTATNTGAKNLWQTYFKYADEYNNAYDGSPYLGGNHSLNFNIFKIANKTGVVDGAKYEDPIIYDKLGYWLNPKNGVANSNGVFSSDNFNQAMEFKSQGAQGVTSKTQFSSYVISFTTQHTDSHEVDLNPGPKNQQFSGISANIYSYQDAYYNMFSRLYGEQRALNPAGVALNPKDIIPNWVPANDAMKKIHTDYLNNAQINVLRNKIQNNITDHDAVNNIIKEGNSLNDAMKKLGNSIGQYDSDGSFANHKEDTTKASDRYKYANPDKKAAYDNATEVTKALINKDTGTYADQATVENLTDDENKAWSALDGVKPKDNEVNSPVGGTITIEKGHTLDSTDAANAITNKDSLTNVKSYSWSGTPDTSKPGSISPKVIVTYNDGTADEVPVTVKIKGDADKYNPEGGEITVNRNTKLGPTEAKEAIKNAQTQNLPKGTTYSWAGEKLPDTSTPGQKNGWVVVTYPDTSRDIVLVKINVKKDAESYTVTPNNEVSVDKGEDVDPASLVTVTDPDGKPTTLPAGSIDWKDGIKPDLTTPGDKTSSVEVTFLDGSKKDTDVTIHVKTDAETYDPKAQPWTTTVGKTPKADEVISSTDKNGKKMPSDAKYTWKTEPNTSKTGEAFGEVKVTYSDGSQDEVHVTINVKDKLDDNEKYHIYGKDGLKVNKDQTLDPKDAIDVRDADGNKTTLPEGSTVKWTKEPDFSQAGKDVTGEVTVTYPDHTHSDPVPVTVHVTGQSDKYKVAPKDNVIVPRGSQVDPESTVVAQTPDGKPTSFPDGTKHKWVTPPDTSTTGNRTGVVETTFSDGSTTRTTVTVKVQPNQSDEYDPHGPENPDDRVPVKDPDHLTDGDKNKVKDEVVNVNSDLPKGTEVTVDDKGKATIKYPDKSTDTIKGSDLVRPTEDKDNYDPKGPKNPDDRVPVKDPEHLTKGDEDKVKGEVGTVNPNLPKGTEVEVDDKGNATIKYPDKSTDTIPGSDLVRPTEDKDNYDPKGPKNPDDRVPVKDPEHLTKGDEDKVKGEVGTVNPNLPKGTEVEVDDKGNATIKYPDKSTDTIPGSDLVRPTEDKDNYDPKGPKNPDDRVPVKDPEHLTKGDKDKVKGEVGTVNPNLPKGTEVEVDDKGNATIKYPDKSTDTIPGSDLVRPTEDKDNYDPKGPKNPDDRVPVKDPEHLTKGDKDKVKGEVGTVNPNLPKGTEVEVDDKGNATIKYPDKSTDTIPGSDLVRPAEDADNITPTVPGDKVTVKDPSHLTEGEKDQVKTNVTNANKDKFPAGTEVRVGDDGTATVTYPDGSKDTIPGDQLVQGQKGDTTDAGNITPTVPGGKVTVKDPSHLTDDEKNQVKNNVDNANKDKFPAGTEVAVGDDGTATVTYPDGSKDTIPGDQLVQGQKGDTTDAGNITPTVPGDKVTVKDPSHLTDDEKNQVKNNVDNANKDKFPDGTKVTVGDDGTTTVTYPDGSQDTIPGDQLVQGQKGDTTDAGNITPTVPGGKVTVKDPSHLTEGEKNQVKNNVDNANKDKFPDGTTVTVGDDGTATVTYPDGSKDVIAGTDLVIAAKGEDVLGSKYHSHKNGSNSSQADRVKGASTANGSIANAGNNLGVKAETDNAFVGVKAESDNAIGNNKATSLKTLPQTGTKDTSILGVLGMLLASLGLFVFKKKRDEK